jgi:hypothetical protein
MTETKIKVPEEMLKAAIDSVARLEPNSVTVEHYRTVLSAAVLWLRENPIRPSTEQMGEMINDLRLADVKSWERGTDWYRAELLCEEWQRRMFLAELAVPSELSSIQGIALGALQSQNELDHQVNLIKIEAFRRGKESILRSPGVRLGARTDTLTV